VAACSTPKGIALVGKSKRLFVDLN